MNDRFELSADEMRRLGYRTVDYLVDHLAGLRDARVSDKAPQRELRALIPSAPPDGPVPFDEVLESLKRGVFSHIMRVNHPRFFGFIPSTGNYISALGDFLASGFNVFEGTWLASSGPSTVELILLEWIAGWLGWPSDSEGIFVSGGSAANLTALAVAREERLRGHRDNAVVYFSDQTHSSIDRALMVLGFRVDQMRRIPSDSGLRLDAAGLSEEIGRDSREGLEPFCVVVNAGTTSTGAVDPIDRIADLCAEHRLWLHVDGAFGAAAAICDEGKRLLRGIERADSVSLDPHKWLFQNIECGCVLVRDPAALSRTFRIMPAYLQDVHREAEVHFCDRGVQLTRSFRALKLWLSIQYFGVEAFRSAIERSFRLAEFAERRLRESGDWQIVTPAQMAIVSFRHARSSRDLVAAAFEDGFAMLTSTVIAGQPALRLCTINPRTTEDDLDQTIARLNRLAG